MPKGVHSGSRGRNNFVSGLRTLYLHEDGHAVLIREKEDKQAGRIQWAEVYEDFGPKCSFKGRIIFSDFYDYEGSRGLPNLIKQASRVKAGATEGSKKSKELGLVLNSCDIEHKDWNVHLLQIEDVLSGAFTYQPDNIDSWETVKDRYSYAGYNIAKKILKGGKEEE